MFLQEKILPLAVIFYNFIENIFNEKDRYL